MVVQVHVFFKLVISSNNEHLLKEAKKDFRFFRSLLHKRQNIEFHRSGTSTQANPYSGIFLRLYFVELHWRCRPESGLLPLFLRRTLVSSRASDPLVITYNAAE
ncbi:hypothetical protein AN958_06890 [Leucoagaricus sp. SymC.cos]|nr:hypothetical protein AN958_06890 [Leucoagaricus sp. SymC.cos]